MRLSLAWVVAAGGCSPLALPIDSGAGSGSAAGTSEGTSVPTTEPASGGSSDGSSEGSGGESQGTSDESGGSTGAAVCVPATGTPGEAAYVRQATGSGQQTIQAVALDGTGDVLIAGNFAGALELGGASVDSVEGVAPFVARLDCAGALRWLVAGTAEAGASGPAYALTLVGDDVYIGGPLVGTIGLPDGSTLAGGAGAGYVARLAGASGEVVRTVVLEGGAVDVHGLGLGGNGGVFAAGACRRDGNEHGVLLAELSPDPFLVTQRCLYAPAVAEDAVYTSGALALGRHPGGDVYVGGMVTGPLADLALPAVQGTGDAFVGRVAGPLVVGPGSPFADGWPVSFGGNGRDRVNGIAATEDGTDEVVVVGLGRGQFFADGPAACQQTGDFQTGFVTRLDANGQCVAHEMLQSDATGATEAHAVAVRGGQIYVLGQFFRGLGVGGTPIAEADNDHGIRMFMLALGPTLKTVQAQHFSGEDFAGTDCSATEEARALGYAIAADDSVVAVVADACGTGINVAGAAIADTDAFVLGLFPVP